MDLKTKMIFILTLMISSTESRLDAKSKLKEHNTQPTQHSLVPNNICDVIDRESKVHCYCDSTEIRSATKAECWVFNGGITEQDEIWTSFISQPYLERLTFSIRTDGALTFIPVKSFRKLNRLKLLSIQYATIQNLKGYTFANSSSLRELFLARNKIIVLEKFSLSHMKMLANLTLIENKINEIEREVFLDLPNLIRLHLSNNNISILHDGCFENLNNLVELVLDMNAVSALTRDSFKGLSNLVRLDLRSNRLEMLADLTFVELWNLKDLLLDNNEISYISERAFDGLTQLSKLSMTGNKLHKLNEGLLEGVRGLALLDLRNNELTTLTYETVRPVMDNMKSNGGVMYLTGNPFVCDCRMSWVHNLRNETNGDSLREALDAVTCVVGLNISREIVDTTPSSPVPSDIYKKTENEITTDNRIKTEDNNHVDDDIDNNDSDLNNVTYLVSIPDHSLPCPKEVLDDDLPPSYDEVRSMFSSSSTAKMSSVTVTLFILMLF